tara:strand:+ start:8209 stop:9675 length:1467 start_codon:yes stop_codon:yes gene_type:complete
MNILENHLSWFEIDSFEKKPINNLKAILVPYAGNKESKDIATEVYKYVPTNYNHVIILSTNHHDKKNYILNMDEINEYGFNFKIDNLNLDINNFELNIDKNIKIFEKEHSWKIQLPFLKILNINIITPILVGSYSDNLLNDIYNNLNENILIIGNIDLLHCGNNNNCMNNIYEFNLNTIQNIINNYKFNKVRHEYNTMNGFEATKLFLNLLKKYKYYLYYYNNLSYIWDKNSLGYPNMLFLKNENVIKKIKLPLLSIPRYVMNYMYFNNVFDIETILMELNKLVEYEELDYEYGNFITIEKRNELRGCIGTFNLSRKIGSKIAINTIKSALYDSRFNKIKKNELIDLTYKINFLEQPIIIYKNNLKNIDHIYKLIKDEFELGKDGMTIYYSNNKSATYLSNVFLDSFKINVFNIESFSLIEESLRKKCIGELPIKKIEKYKCDEYNEYDDLKLNQHGGQIIDNYVDTTHKYYPLFLIFLAIIGSFNIK